MVRGVHGHHRSNNIYIRIMAQIGKDKLNHYIVATWIAGLLLPFFDRIIYLDFLGQYAVFLGYISCLLGFTGYEYYQKWTKKGTFDWYDVLYGGWGAGVILVVILATKG